MKFSISRDSLVKSLNLVAGVVERRQTLPILANVLLVLTGRRRERRSAPGGGGCERVHGARGRGRGGWRGDGSCSKTAGYL